LIPDAHIGPDFGSLCHGPLPRLPSCGHYAPTRRGDRWASALPRLNSPDRHPPALTLRTLHAPGKLVQRAIETHELRHDGRQDHRDVATALASGPEVMAEECSLTVAAGRPTQTPDTYLAPAAAQSAQEAA
jgi:hypothetical protein